MKRLWLFSCLLLVAMTGLASAQITFDFTGAGARAEGMGRAYFGIADDASSITWNPAGLVAHDKPILRFSYELGKGDETVKWASDHGRVVVMIHKSENRSIDDEVYTNKCGRCERVS